MDLQDFAYRVAREIAERLKVEGIKLPNREEELIRQSIYVNAAEARRLNGS